LEKLVKLNNYIRKHDDEKGAKLFDEISRSLLIDLKNNQYYNRSIPVTTPQKFTAFGYYSFDEYKSFYGTSIKQYYDSITNKVSCVDLFFFQKIVYIR